MAKKKQTVDINKLLANEDIIDVDISDVVKTSTINYAMSVITDRALPDIRDGLKPVQRRILYAGLVKGYTPNKQYIKCAKFSGDVMGEYHPHSSCYSTIANMSKPWAFRYPLIDFHGNNGNLDGQQEAAERYCVTGDSLINTNKGLQYIKDIVDNELNTDNDVDIYVKSIHTNNHASKLFNSGIHDTYKITLVNGLEITGTENHPLLVNNFEWKTISQLNITDKCIVNSNINNVLFGNLTYAKSVEELCCATKETQYNYLLNLFEDNKLDNSVCYVAHSLKEAKILQIILITNFGIYVDRLHTMLLIADYDKFINQTQNDTYYKIPIKSIEGTGKQVVYSIKVDSECHSFTANGFINHNTESRLQKTAMSLLDTIYEDTVEFIPNYSETTTEPTVLPGLFPNLLCNGSYGIAVGYTTNFPPHNLNEVIDAIIYSIQHKDFNIDDLLSIIKGPDFPLGACLVNNDNIKKLYTDGQASLTFKATYEVETNEETNNPQIVFTAIPPSVNKPKLMEQIHKLCIEEKSIPRVVDVRDESSGASGIRIVVELNKTAVVNVVVNELFKNTNLQQNVSFIMRCIVDNTPKLPSLVDIIQNYIDFHFDCKKKSYVYKLNDLKSKLHIQEGYYKILNDLDSAIKIIRNADNDLIAKDLLIKQFDLSEAQVNVILEMKLRRLTKLGKQDIEDQINKLQEQINHYDLLINDEKEFIKDFISQLQDLKKQFGDDRRTILIDEEEAQEEVVDEDYIIVLTNKNNIKHYKEEDFNLLKAYKDKSDIFKKSFKYNTKNKLLFILEDCSYVVLSFNQILGDLNKLLNKQKIINIFDYETFISKTLFVITNRGIVKKIPLDKLKVNGKLYPIVEVKDEVIVNAKLIDNNNQEVITILTDDGKIGRFLVQSFKETNAGGKGLNLSADNIRDFDVSTQKSYIVVIGENTIAKFNDSDFLIKGRIAKPINAIKSNEMKFIKCTNDNIEVVTDKGLLKQIPLEKVKVINKNTKPITIKENILFLKGEHL